MFGFLRGPSPALPTPDDHYYRQQAPVGLAPLATEACSWHSNLGLRMQFHNIKLSDRVKALISTIFYIF